MSVVSLVDRHVLTRLVQKAVTPLVILGLIGLVPALVILISRGGPGLSTAPQFGLGLAAGLAFLAMGYFYFRAAQVEEISRVVPLLYLSPAIVAVLAGLFLGEHLSGKKYLGLGLLIVGAILISSRTPFRFHRGPALGFMIIAAAFLAGYSLATKSLLRQVDYWTVFAWARIGMFAGIVPVFLRRRGLLRAETSGARGVLVAGLMGVNEVLAMAASFLFTVAAAQGPISLVTALQSTQPFFVLILGLGLALIWPGFLGERTDPRSVALKVGAVATMFVGLYLIS